MKLPAIFLASLMITGSMQAMKNLRGYNGRMEDKEHADHPKKKVQSNASDKRREWRTFEQDGVRFEVYTANSQPAPIGMELVDNGSRGQESIMGLVSVISYIACCFPCILINEVCCPKKSH